MQRLITTAVLALVAGTALVAQQVRPLPQAELYGELLKLQSFTSVLYIAAHPDDENTRLLSWLARGKHIRTAYLSLTRGDGGQNILGSEQGAALGLIRTNELLAARRLDGAEQFFARAIDFGYSKTAEETFKHWDKEALTQDVVQVIEQFRPDVVICRFPASRMAGHGQHEASAIIAKAAFDACPQNIRPKRLLFNAYRFSDRSTIADDQFALEVGQYDPLLGMGYGELAGYSRSLHKSQGAGTRSTPGVQNEYFETLGGEPPSTSLFDGLDTTWLRVGRPDIGHRIGQVIERFWDGPPSDVLPELLKIRDMISKMREPLWKDLKLQQIDRVIISAMGLTADLSVNTPIAVAGDSLSATLRIVARADTTPVEIVGLAWTGQATNRKLSLPHDSLREETIPYWIPEYQQPTQPYWLVDEPAGDLYAVASLDLLGRPMTPPSLTMTVTLRIADAEITTELPLSYKTTDPLDGDVIEELRIVPIVSVEPTSRLTVRTPKGLTASVRLRAYQALEDATVVMRSAEGERVIAKGLSMRASTDTLISFTPKVKSSQQVSFIVRVNGSAFDRGVKVIDYDHLPTLQYLEPARMTIVPEQIAVTAKRVAFIPGAGEYAPDFLRELGVVVEEVNEDQILRIDEMLTYDAVLVGIRAVNINDNMKYIMPALMEYVKRGGTLVLQYNTSRGLSTEELGPYPLTLGRDRVTEEDAAVTILKPQNPVLTTPNPISQADFDGWVQERGLYFPSERDQRYEAVLSMHDTGEEPLDGSLLYAKYGKGHYVYCALSLFRELPAGVPGGMKLMANMVSLGR